MFKLLKIKNLCYWFDTVKHKYIRFNKTVCRKQFLVKIISIKEKNSKVTNLFFLFLSKTQEQITINTRNVQ